MVGMVVVAVVRVSHTTEYVSGGDGWLFKDSELCSAPYWAARVGKIWGLAASLKGEFLVSPLLKS